MIDSTLRSRKKDFRVSFNSCAVFWVFWPNFLWFELQSAVGNSRAWKVLRWKAYGRKSIITLKLERIIGKFLYDLKISTKIELQCLLCNLIWNFPTSIDFFQFDRETFQLLWELFKCNESRSTKMRFFQLR